MTRESCLQFKIADQAAEFEAIHRLNHRTFAGEIPQHAPREDGLLIDRFHPENTYVVCLDEGRLVGMICGRARRPFSLDAKLDDLDRHLPGGRVPFEIRLLAVEKAHRKGRVFAGLAARLAEHFRDQGCDLAVISGTTRELPLYAHVGFVPFGPLVGSGEARFQPMYLELERFLRAPEPLVAPPAEPASYLCGPVAVSPRVRSAFSRSPVSHRSRRFSADFRSVKRMLCRLTGARHVEVLLGSGTLANDAVAAELALRGGQGVVLSNGEFGERLVDHAARHGLRFQAQRCAWGEPLDYAALRDLRERRIEWLWAVHCETSTGVLNDLAALKRLCADQSVSLCLDCISSVGTLAVDLEGVTLASCVSGKGLASFPGLSMVFHDDLPTPGRARPPRYLDLRYYAAQEGVPFTTSSNLVYALQAALASTDWPAKYARTAAAGAALRAKLRGLGFAVLAPDSCAAPAVVTLVIPEASRVGARLQKAGYLVGCDSGYLVERNWLQIALMGEWSQANLESLLAELALAASFGL
jgi:aspartate aminotransferase-like enzyme